MDLEFYFTLMGLSTKENSSLGSRKDMEESFTQMGMFTMVNG